MSATVTGRAVRGVGYTSPWLLDATGGVEPSLIALNDDGTMTLTFPCDVPPETLAVVKERMESRTDTAAALRQALVDAQATVAADPVDVTVLRTAVLNLIALATGTD